MQRPVAQEPQSACRLPHLSLSLTSGVVGHTRAEGVAVRARVGCQVAANVARPLGAQIQRHRKPVAAHVRVQLLQNASRLADQRAAHLLRAGSTAFPFPAPGCESAGRARERTASKESTRLRPAVERTTSSCTGVLPPTSPVLPPCNQTYHIRPHLGEKSFKSLPNTANRVQGARLWHHC